MEARTWLQKPNLLPRNNAMLTPTDNPVPLHISPLVNQWSRYRSMAVLRAAVFCIRMFLPQNKFEYKTHRGCAALRSCRCAAVFSRHLVPHVKFGCNWSPVFLPFHSSIPPFSFCLILYPFSPRAFSLVAGVNIGGSHIIVCDAWDPFLMFCCACFPCPVCRYFVWRIISLFFRVSTT